ncbi:alpha/beta hydrolase family protein [Desmospora profundinema]|uniref:Pimeloyl-ACP methyl ester carboxylesterase n=1 Tax=Desmospora profundinema TaxID=1571184 RepID=A0ABU1IMA5_9BACL|nr:alpha/beta fold hydrolase [Desmospora profundinema]MDR6225912.1 pimeloyl-ACP methyl ester carboxylesterase [Desmospora profundinema]
MAAIQTHSFQLDLKKEGRLIRGEVRVPDTSRSLPTVIFCHGFKGFRQWGFFPYAAETLAKYGFAAITFDFSMNGVGEDGENFTELERFARNTYSREQEDLSRLVAALTARELPGGAALDPDRLALIGHSRGGANSLLFALEHPEVNGVVLWNSIAKPDLFSDELKARIRREGRATIPNARTGQEMPIDREVLDDLESNRERYNLTARLQHYDKPVLILQGDADPSVRPETANLLAQAAPKSEYHFLAGADHTFGAVHPFRGSTSHLDETLERTISFLQKLLIR